MVLEMLCDHGHRPLDHILWILSVWWVSLWHVASSNKHFLCFCSCPLALAAHFWELCGLVHLIAEREQGQKLWPDAPVPAIFVSFTGLWCVGAQIWTGAAGAASPVLRRGRISSPLSAGSIPSAACPTGLAWLMSSLIPSSLSAQLPSVPACAGLIPPLGQ